VAVVVDASATEKRRAGLFEISRVVPPRMTVEDVKIFVRVARDNPLIMGSPFIKSIYPEKTSAYVII
jgi:hypothetical protein